MISIAKKRRLAFVAGLAILLAVAVSLSVIHRGSKQLPNQTDPANALANTVEGGTGVSSILAAPTIEHGREIAANNGGETSSGAGKTNDDAQRLARGTLAYSLLTSAIATQASAQAYKLESKELDPTTGAVSLITRYQLARDGKPALMRLDVQLLPKPGLGGIPQGISRRTNDTGYYEIRNDIAYLVTGERDNYSTLLEAGELIPFDRPSSSLLMHMDSYRQHLNGRDLIAVVIDAESGIFGPPNSAVNLPQRTELLIDTSTNFVSGIRLYDKNGALVKESIYTSIDTTSVLDESFFSIPDSMLIVSVRDRQDISTMERLARRKRRSSP